MPCKSVPNPDVLALEDHAPVINRVTLAADGGLIKPAL